MKKFVGCLLLVAALTGCGKTPVSPQSAPPSVSESQSAPDSELPETPPPAVAPPEPSSQAEPEPEPEPEPPARELDPDEYDWEDLPFVSQGFDAFSSDSVASYAAVLLESGGEGIDAGILTGKPAYRSGDDEREYQSLEGAFKVAKNYLFSEFCGVPVAVKSIETLPGPEDDPSDVYYVSTYRLVLEIPESAAAPFSPGEQTWYLRTAIIPYSDARTVDWLMPETEYAAYLDAQSHRDDIRMIMKYTTWNYMLKQPYFSDPLELGETDRARYLLMAMPGGNGFSADQAQMDGLSQKVFGISPFVNVKNVLAEYGGEYALNEGSGSPFVNNYIGLRVQDGDTARYTLYAYDDANPDGFRFRGFVQKRVSAVEYSVRDGCLQSCLEVPVEAAQSSPADSNL